MEKNVTSKLEASFSTLKGLEDIKSKSSKGFGYITLKFDKHTDMKIARFEIATIVRQLYKKLPPDVTYPNIDIHNPSQEEHYSLLSYSIKSPESRFKIQEVVKNQLIPEFASIQGIERTDVFGANPEEYIVSFNRPLTFYNLSKQEVISSIRQANQIQSLGISLSDSDQINVAVHQEDHRIDWHIPIKKIGTKIIYLDQICTIKKFEKEATAYYRVNGENTITLNFTAVKTANSLLLAKQIKAKIVELEPHLPHNYTIFKVYDSTTYLNKELNKIYTRGAFTFGILIIFILLLYRNIGHIILILSVMVANLCMSFVLYYIFDVEIQLYSLAGITISLGLMLDNCIVMMDYTKKRKDLKIILPILASTLTTIAALSVIFLLGNNYNLTDFAVVVIINLSVSLLTTFYLVPALMDKIKIKDIRVLAQPSNLYQRFEILYVLIIKNALQFKKTLLLFIILIFGLPLFLLPEKLDNNETFYERAYNSTIGSDWYNDNLKPALDQYLGGTLRLFNKYVYQNAVYGNNEETKLVIMGSMEKGSTVHQINEVFLELEKYLINQEKVLIFSTTIYNSHEGKIEIIFDEKHSQTSYPFEVKSVFIKKAIDYGGMDWNIYGVGNGFNSGVGNEPINYSIKAKGYNYDELNLLAKLLKKELEKNSRVQKAVLRDANFFSGKASYLYRFSLDREKLALKETSQKVVIGNLKENSMNSNMDLLLPDDGTYTSVRLETEQSKHNDLWMLSNTPFDSLHKPLVLKTFATLKKEKEEENIYKEDQEYLRMIDFQYIGSSNVGSKLLDEVLKKFKEKTPLGYTFERDDRNGHQESNEDSYLAPILLVIALIFLICSILFESLWQPFIVLCIIPITYIGVFLTFYLFEFNFDQGGFACFILLSGISVNASIYMVTEFNNLYKLFPHIKRVELYLLAFKEKIIPILLSIVSILLSFIPFVINGQNEVFWFALGIGTIGGLVFTVIGIFLYLPLLVLKKEDLIK